jgi:hypothetical protein
MQGMSSFLVLQNAHGAGIIRNVVHDTSIASFELYPQATIAFRRR